MRHVLIGSILLLAATPAVADTPTGPKPPKGSPNETVCRREVDTGSLIRGRRTCMTRAQWQAQAEAAQASAQRQEELSRINSEAPR